MPRNETLLSPIDDMVLLLESARGHQASVNVAELLATLTEPTGHTIRRLQCP